MVLQTLLYGECYRIVYTQRRTNVFAILATQQHLEYLNLGCLHPVARVISYDMGFNPSTQR
jgi:hypothetical protein